MRLCKTARAIRVNITLPEDILAKIDAYAELRGMNRSGFLVHAAKHEIDAFGTSPSGFGERDGRL